MIGLDQTGQVYVRGPDGTFTVAAGGPFAVRLCGPATESSALERAELSGARHILWGPVEVVPDGCEVEVEAERWTLVRGSQARYRGPNGGVVYQRADVVRADA